MKRYIVPTRCSSSRCKLSSRWSQMRSSCPSWKRMRHSQKVCSPISNQRSAVQEKASKRTIRLQKRSSKTTRRSWLLSGKPLRQCSPLFVLGKARSPSWHCTLLLHGKDSAADSVCMPWLYAQAELALPRCWPADYKMNFPKLHRSHYHPSWN